jgi:phosphate transport system substrate-binding protein
MSTRNIFIFLGLTAILAACENRRADGTVVDTPTSGEISIMVDEGYRPVIETSIDVFDSIYRARFHAKYVSESEAVKGLLDDSTEVIIITRSLKDDEMAFFKARGFTPRITPIAYDAVAFILNPANRDTLLTTDQLRDILNGKTDKWSQINPKSGLGDIQLVFDNAGSGTVRYCRDTIAGGAELPKSVAALQTNAVAKHKNTIGIIGANWISDTDDKGVQAFRREIKLLDVAKAPGEEGFGPYQAYLATRQYPFRRTVYIINCQGRAGLGLGFASFLASDPGQRIVMKSGLLAANVPIRLMKVVKE